MGPTKNSLSRIFIGFIFIANFIGFVPVTGLAINSNNYKIEINKQNGLDDNIYANNSLDLTPDIDISNQFTALAESEYQIVYDLDFNSDGFLDFLIGTDNSELYLYENQGLQGTQSPNENPSWILNQDFTLPDLPENISLISPAMGDLDNDTDLDLVIGTDNGRILLNENLGTNSTPIWGKFVPLTDIGGSEIIFYDNKTVNGRAMVNPIIRDFDKYFFFCTQNFTQVFIEDGYTPEQATQAVIDNGYDTIKCRGLDIVVTTSAKEVLYYIHKDYLDQSPVANEPTVQFDNSSKYGFVEFKELILMSVDNSPLNITKFDGEGNMRFKFSKLTNDRLEVLFIEYQSGEYYMFLLVRSFLRRVAVLLNLNQPFESFKLPDIDFKPDSDFIYSDLDSDGFSDIILFEPNGNVHFSTYYRSNIIKTSIYQNIISQSTEIVTVADGYQFTLIFLTFLIYTIFLRKFRKNR